MPPARTLPRSVQQANPFIGFTNPVPAKLKQPATVARPAPPSLSSLPVDPAQCEKAVKALVTHVQKSQAERDGNELLEGEENVFLVVTLRKMPKRESHRPVSIPLPHSIIDSSTSSICLITKDPQREYKDLLASQGIDSISRVVGVSKLKGKFKPFEARRQLLSENDLFLVDDRVVEVLGKVLGKAARQAKKQPIPISLTSPPSTLSQHIAAALSSTHFLLPLGTCLTIKLGSISTHTPSQLLDNLKAVLPYLAARLPDGGWDNVQALNVKTNRSVALPIWNSGAGAGVIAAAPAAKESDSGKKRKSLDGGDVKEKGKKRKSDVVDPLIVSQASPAKSLAKTAVPADSLELAKAETEKVASARKVEKGKKDRLTREAGKGNTVEQSKVKSSGTKKLRDGGLKVGTGAGDKKKKKKKADE